jgi:hypothetical protein
LMGGRKGSSAKRLLGKGGSIHQSNIQRKLKNGSAEVVAEAVVAALATSNPAIAAAYLAYRVVKFAAPIIEKGSKEYDKSHDKDRAKEKMKEELVKQTGREVRDAAVGAVVGAAVDSTKVTANIKTNEIADTFVKEAISGTISEVLNK